MELTINALDVLNMFIMGLISSYVCNGSDKSIHKKCIGLTNEQYHNLQSGSNDKTWYCGGPCNSFLFSFFSFSNYDLKNNWLVQNLITHNSNKQQQ